MGLEEKVNALKAEEGLIDIDKYLSKPGNCSCGQGMKYVGLGIYRCENCGDEFKNEYGIIRDFVDKYGTTYSILEIADLTGVPKRIIDLFIRDGKFAKAAKQRVCCVCHKPIESGMYCNVCALRQIGDAMDNDRKKLSGSLRRNSEMEGIMHYRKGKE